MFTHKRVVKLVLLLVWLAYACFILVMGYRSDNFSLAIALSFLPYTIWLNFSKFFH